MGDGLADDIVDVIAYEAPMPVSTKEFLPWHRPRKQFVRERQWTEQIVQMLNEAPPAEGVLKYLGLPGDDLLDLRHFHTAICQVLGHQLRFLGFNSSAAPDSASMTEMNIALDEVRRLPSVDKRSDVIGDNFAMIANDQSLAFQRTRELGPYDVINLDLCDGFGAKAPNGPLNEDYYTAIARLMGIQARTSNPWLLLLTTRTDKVNIHDEVLDKLIKKYVDNLSNSGEFKQASKELLEIECEATLKSVLQTPSGLQPVFLTGLCKWMLAMGLGQNPPTKLEVKSVVGYRVNGASEGVDLVSLAIRFTPIHAPAGDALGLAKHPVAIPQEGPLATKAIKRIVKAVDVDSVLNADIPLLDEMIKRMEELLSVARYDTSKYRDWIKVAA